ncbi:hypothetical protein [Gordonia aichiensis]
MSTDDQPETRVSGEVWDSVTSVDHHTFIATARGYRRDGSDAPSGEDINTITLTPYIGENEGEWFVISLKASAKLPNYFVEFEEAARITLDADLQLGFEELQEFGSEYVLPFLLPYVESGFTRMCREVDERPPRFPFIVMQGSLLKHPAYAESTDAEGEGRANVTSEDATASS